MAKKYLTATITILAVMIFFNFMQLMGFGTFLADYYYLPLHEYVDADRHRDMEDTVIGLYNSAAQRSAVAAVILLAIAMGLVVSAYRNMPTAERRE